MDDDIGVLLADQLAKLLERGDYGQDQTPALWSDLADLGAERALVSESAGGHGLAWRDLDALSRVWGAAAGPVPLGDAIVAGWIAERAGVDLPEMPLTLEPDKSSPPVRPGAARLAVRASEVGDEIYLLSPDAAAAPEASGVTPRGLTQAARAVFLAGQIAGALARILEMSVDYAQTRTQFGRSIGRFQAVQILAASLAMEAAAAEAAAAFGFRTLERDPALAAAVAKGRTSRAATAGAALAHQIHGAIGVTEEHALHRLTKALWTWRDDAGGEHAWARTLGERLRQEPETSLWRWLTASVDPKNPAAAEPLDA